MMYYTCRRTVVHQNQLVCFCLRTVPLLVFRCCRGHLAELDRCGPGPRLEYIGPVTAIDSRCKEILEFFIPGLETNTQCQPQIMATVCKESLIS